MQKKLLSLLVLLMTTATGAWAGVDAGGWCGSEVEWQLTDDGVMTIWKSKGSGAMADCTYDTQPWKYLRDKITSVVVEAGVTHIGNYAFALCTNLATVTFSAGSHLTTIGNNAFRGCSGLGSITIPASVTSIGHYAFIQCTNLATVTFSEGSNLTTIGHDAFYECGSLGSIAIPDGVTSIGDFTFYYCSELSSVSIPASVTSIGLKAFYDCSKLSSVSIPASVTTIGNSAFDGCTKLATVTFSEDSHLTTIGNWAFGHTALSSIAIPDGVTSIGESAFSYCQNAGFTEITIPANVTTIGRYAFYACNKLTTVTFSAGSHLTSIGDNAFDGCTKLATVTFNSNPSIGTSAFDGIKADATVTMNVPANAAGGAKWTTFYNQNYSFAADENTEVFKVALSGTELTLNKVADGIVDAGTAVVLKTTGDNPVMTKTTTASGDEQANDLTGVSAAAGVENNGTFYVLNSGSQGVGFYKLKSGKTVGVGKAYLTYTAGAREFFGFDETTGLKAIDNGPLGTQGRLPEQELTTDNVVYDLQGRRVSQPTKGLYIENGKKIVIK